ncbi:MAG TPA: AMP-binding protein [Sphingomonadaceae bacterium]|nr:AMP-binding protein [Sphingomonadaceae bacterium]
MTAIVVREQCIGDAVDNAAARWGDRVGWVFEDVSVSFRQMRDVTDEVAKALMAAGVQPGDVVAAWMPNLPEFAAIEFACAKIGALCVAINTRFKAFEVAHMLRESRPTVLFLVQRFLKHDNVVLLEEIGIDPAAPSGEFGALRALVAVGECADPRLTAWRDFLAAGARTGFADLQERQAERDWAEPMLIQYTSGTTAAPKGAMLNHRYVLNVGNELFANLSVGEGDPVMNTQPFYHIGGSCGALPTPLTLGCRMVIPEYYEAERVLRLIQRERCVARTGFAAMYFMEIDHPRYADYDTSSVRAGWCSGTPEMLERVRNATGIPYLMLTYSSTEVGGTASHWSDSWEQRSASAGRPLVGTELAIVDPETGVHVDRDAIGEIVMRGWWKMNGYFRQPALTAKTIDADGWVHTGDRGYVDEHGCLHFLGRFKDMLKVGGENVSAEEIEGFLMTHPKIKQVAVIAAPDPRLEEVPLAIVEPVDGGVLDEAEVIAFCKDKVANFRVPRYVRITREWPLTGSGKIQKNVLRDLYLPEFRNALNAATPA